MLDQEALGSKRKFWYQDPRNGTQWLFKYPRPGTGEHWAEKIAAEVAARLCIPHAIVELAQFEKSLGSATLSFASDTGELIHGNQILAGNVLGYDPDRRFRNSDHTLANIRLALTKVFLSGSEVRDALSRFESYLVLDALIGNTDRHHENWGVLRHSSNAYLPVVAPSFDHASSLGRELPDTGGARSRAALLSAGSIGTYARKARGGIYWTEQDPHGVSPLQLVRSAAAAHPEFLKCGLEKLQHLNPEVLSNVVVPVPDEWMSSTARRFAVELMCYNLRELRKLVP